MTMEEAIIFVRHNDGRRLEGEVMLQIEGRVVSITADAEEFWRQVFDILEERGYVNVLKEIHDGGNQQ